MLWGGYVPALRGVHLSHIGCSTIEHTHVHTLQWRSFTPNTRKPTLALTHVSMQGVSTVSLSPDRISDGCSGTHLPLLYLLGGQRSHENQLSGFRRSRTQFPYWGSAAALAGSLIQTLGHRRSLAFVTHFIPPVIRDSSIPLVDYLHPPGSIPSRTRFFQMCDTTQSAPSPVGALFTLASDTVSVLGQ